MERCTRTPLPPQLPSWLPALPTHSLQDGHGQVRRVSERRAGAKLANIFSKEFVVETADSSEGKRFKQVGTHEGRSWPMAHMVV